MLIIGHRGAAGLKPENTIAALRAGMDAGADMLEFDVRLTKDNIPVLAHDFHTWRTHRSAYVVSRMTFAELKKRTAGTKRPIVSLEAALKECFGKVLLNIELKQRRSSKHILPVVEKYIVKKSDWKQFLFSSFLPSELARTRKLAPDAQLALLQHVNPLAFLTYHNALRLSAVGFHRLYVNKAMLGTASRLGLLTYAYTVNRPEAALRLAERGFDAVVTDRPDLLASIKTRHKGK